MVAKTTMAETRKAIRVKRNLLGYRRLKIDSKIHKVGDSAQDLVKLTGTQICVYLCKGMIKEIFKMVTLKYVR